MLDLAGKPRSITTPTATPSPAAIAPDDSTKNGWLKSSTDAAGRTTTLDYDAAGNVTFRIFDHPFFLTLKLKY